MGRELVVGVCIGLVCGFTGACLDPIGGSGELANAPGIGARDGESDAGSGRRYEGTGIGLSIVRDILRLHGCSIRVASEPGVGSTFSFTLPLARSQTPTRPQDQARRSSSNPGS